MKHRGAEIRNTFRQKTKTLLENKTERERETQTDEEKKGRS